MENNLERHYELADLHRKCMDLYDQALETKGKDKNTLLEQALKYELEVFHGAIDLNLNDITKYAYGKGAAAIAYRLGQFDQYKEILEKTRESIKNSNLISNINESLEKI